MRDLNMFTRDGKLLMLALDHRGSFQKLMNLASQGEALQRIVDAKSQIIESLYDQFSGILLDPQFGLPAYQQYTQKNNIINPKPYLLSIEKTGYTDSEGERLTELEYSVAELAHMDASGIKILLYFHPDANSVVQQLETARSVLSECQKENLPLFLEIVTYDLVGEKQNKEEIIPRSVELFLEQGVVADVFKLEYPGSEGSCKTITELLGSTPWILLTRGASFEQFKNELKIASQNGAKGFLAGRSLWQEALRKSEEERTQFLTAVCKKRFEEISAIALQS